MKIGTKLKLNGLKISRWIRKSKKLSKKYKRFPETEKFTLERRIQWLSKKTKKINKLLKINLEVSGFDNIPKSTSLIVSNHQSLIDPGLILLALENPSEVSGAEDKFPIFLAKEEIKQNKKAFGFTDLIDSVYIDRSNPRDAIQKMDDLVELAKEENRHIVIFPEGTRSKDGKLHEFKPGAFKIAKKSFLPIIPITINNATSALDLERDGELKIQVIIHAPIKASSLMTSDTTAISNRVKKVIESKYIKPILPKQSKESEV